MAKPKKKSGFSLEDINKFLVDNLVGKESVDLFNKAKQVEAPRGSQGNMPQQFGAMGFNPEVQKLLAQIGLLGKAAASTNVADLLGVKDAYKMNENRSPSSGLLAGLSVAPLGMKGVGKAAKKSVKQVNLLASYLRNLFQE